MAYTPVAKRNNAPANFVGPVLSKAPVSKAAPQSYVPVAQRPKVQEQPQESKPKVYSKDFVGPLPPGGVRKKYSEQEVEQLKKNVVGEKSTGQKVFSAVFENPVSRFIEELPGAAAETGKNVFQGITRNIGSAGVSVAKVVGGGDEAEDYQPGNAVTKAIFGKEPVKSVEKRIAESELKIKDFSQKLPKPLQGPTKKVALPAAALVVGGDVGLDLFPGFGADKNAIKAIAGTKDVGVISKVLKEVGVADDLVEASARKLATISDEKEVAKALETIAETQKNTRIARPAITETIKTDETIAKNAAREAAEEATQVGKVVVKPAEKAAAKEALEAGETIAKTKVAKELEPLAQEAKKYKSAEEFTKSNKAITSVEYHGTSSTEAADSIRKNGFRVGKGQAGVSTTQDYAEALEYAGGDPNKVVTVYIKPDAKTVGIPGKDFITGTGSFAPEDLVPLPKGFTLKNFYEEAVKEGLDSSAKIALKEAADINVPTKPSQVRRAVTDIISPKERVIARKEGVLLRDRIRAEARGAKVGYKAGSKVTRESLIAQFKDSAQQTREIQKNLIKYVQDNLPGTERGKFLQAVQNATTKKKQASIFQRVDKLAETVEKKSIVGEIKELSKTAPNVALDYQRKINDLTKGIDLAKPTEKTLRNLRSLEAYLKRNAEALNLNPELANKIARLAKKNVSEMTKAELTELRDTIKHLQNLGELKLALKHKYNARAQSAAVESLISSTTNKDPKKFLGMFKATKENAKWQAEGMKVYMNTLHTPRVADMIDGFKNYTGENAKIIKRLGRAETNARDMGEEIVASALDEIQKLGIKNLTDEQQVRIMINIRQKEKAFDQVKTLLDKYGFKEVPKLTEQEKKVIDILQKHTNRYTDNIAAVYEEITNQPFKKLDDYVLPIKYEDETHVLPDEMINQNRYRTSKTEQGFTISRQKGVQRTPRTDVLNIFEEAVRDQQWYLHLQPELEDIRHIVLNKRFQEHAGELVSGFWSGVLDTVARKGWSAEAKSSAILRQARMNLNSAVLGYRLSSILMQPMAVFDALSYAQTRYGTGAAFEVLKEFTKSWVKPGATKKIIEASAALRTRKGGEVAIAENLENVGRAVGAYKALQRKALSLISAADVKTAAGVQQGLENVLKKNGITNTKAEAEFLMNLVSGSGDVAYRPLVLSKGELQRTLFTFQTFAMNRWGLIMHDLVKGGLIKGNWKKKLNATLGLSILLAGAIAENEARQAVYEKTTGKELPDESALKIGVTTIPEQIPFFGNLIRAAERGDRGGASPPLIKVFEDGLLGGYRIATGKKPETKVKGGIQLTESLASLIGVPGAAQAGDLLERAVPQEKKQSGPLPPLPKLPKLPKSGLPKLPKLSN